LSNHSPTGVRADAVRNRQLALDATIDLLSGPDATFTVEAIARRSGLGAATVVRAFGGKEALLDAAASHLLEPVVRRARDLLDETTPHRALRAFLRELIAFQSAHHAIGEHLVGLDLPATTSLRAGLVAAVEEMVEGARRDGEIRADLDPAVVRTLLERTALAVARTRPPSQALADAYLTVLLDGLRPPPDRAWPESEDGGQAEAPAGGDPES
jgi:AcrR family transcriptional regulator